MARWNTTDEIAVNEGTRDAYTQRVIVASDVGGTIQQIAAGNAASVRTAFNVGLFGGKVHLEVSGEVYAKLGDITVVATTADYHFHLRAGDWREFQPTSAQPYIALYGIGGAHNCVVWRTSGA